MELIEHEIVVQIVRGGEVLAERVFPDLVNDDTAHPLSFVVERRATRPRGQRLVSGRLPLWPRPQPIRVDLIA